MSGWCVWVLLCVHVWGCRVNSTNSRIDQLFWLSVYKTPFSSQQTYCMDATKIKEITMLNCSSGVSPPLFSLSFACPLAVHPIQAISILQRSTAKAKAKSNRKCVLIRGMKSRAYGALPPLRRPLLGCHGLKIRASSCVSHSNSALMFERAEKMLALHG